MKSAVCVFNAKKFYEMLVSSENIIDKLESLRISCDNHNMSYFSNPDSTSSRPSTSSTKSSPPKNNSPLPNTTPFSPSTRSSKGPPTSHSLSFKFIFFHYLTKQPSWIWASVARMIYNATLSKWVSGKLSEYALLDVNLSYWLRKSFFQQLLYVPNSISFMKKLKYPPKAKNFI